MFKPERTVILLPLFALLSAAQGQQASPSPQLPPGAMRAAAVTKCLECHDASILVQQRLTPTAWAKEVDKMTKWGALVEARDRQPLIDYFSSNFGPDKPPYVAPRSATRTRRRKR